MHGARTAIPILEFFLKMGRHFTVTMQLLVMIRMKTVKSLSSERYDFFEEEDGKSDEKRGGDGDLVYVGRVRKKDRVTSYV